MSGEALAIEPADEDDRLESQRQAFGRLMGRFTADRDAMMAAIQQCNERIDTLTAQIALGGPVTPAEVAGGGAEVRALIERTLAQQQTGIAEARAAGERAQRRTEECVTRVRELAEQAAEKEASVDGLRQVLEGVGERIARLEEAFLAQTPDEAESPLGVEVAQQISERLVGVEEYLHGLEESIESVRRLRERIPAEDGGAQILSLGLRDLRTQVSQLESLAAWTPKLQRLWVSLLASAVVAALVFAYVH